MEPMMTSIEERESPPSLHEARGVRVTLVMAETLDGRIARHAWHPVDWTEPEDKAHFAGLTRRMGLVFMGSHTFDTLGGPLPGRENVVFTRFPERRDSIPGTLVFTSDRVTEVLDRYAARGYGEAALIGGSSLNGVFARLGCIDEMIITLSPVVFGEGQGLFPADIAMDLDLVSLHPLGKDSLLLHYRVQKRQKVVNQYAEGAYGKKT